MTESVLPQNALPTNNAQERPWDVGAISAGLNVEPELTSDLLLGDGVRFQVGDPAQGTTLEVFATGPRAPIVRLTGQDLQLSLFRQEQAPRLAAKGLVFELPGAPEGRWLSLSPATGELALFYDPAAARMSQERSDAAERPAVPDGDAAAASSDLQADADAFQPALPEPRQEKQPRVAFSGRLGTDPRCRTTPRAVLVCAFPVAEKREGFEKPTWRDVVTFKQVAAKVQDSLRKGMFVDVIGYEHEKARKGKDGAVRMAKEIYAVVVKQR